MTDAHCHISTEDSSVRELIIGRDFLGVHPWAILDEQAEARTQHDELLGALREKLLLAKSLGIGEIGLDRLKERKISPRMREVFQMQLKLAFDLRRPVVLHGAKCWGQVVAAVKEFSLAAWKSCDFHSNTQVTGALNIQVAPAFLFHGFSRSDGLIPEIVKLNGFISVGPAVLNDHAVNYRELVKKIPLNRLLVETDRTTGNAATCPSVREVLAKTAELRGLSDDELERITDANAAAFFPAAFR